MATVSTERNKMIVRVVWHSETINTTTFEVVDNATGKRYFYDEHTTVETTRNVTEFDLKEGNVQTPPPNMGIKAYDRTSTMEETSHHVFGEDQKTTKPKYSSK